MADPILKQALQDLMEERLEAISTPHGELYDTYVRRQMFEAIIRTLIKPEPGFEIPAELNMFNPRAS